MDNQKPRVGIFMAAGIVAAIVIGFVVWNASSSDRSAQAGYVSETETKRAQEESPVSKTSKVTSEEDDSTESRRESTQRSGAPRNTAPQPQVNLAQPSNEGQDEAYSLNSDPYAPQHAVVGTAQQQAATRVFRPTNVVPTTVIASSAASAPATGDNGVQSVEGSQATETPQDTVAPSASGAPDESGSTTAPAPATEPTPTTPSSERPQEAPSGAAPMQSPSAAAESAVESAAEETHNQVEQGVQNSPAPAPQEANTPLHGISSEAQQAWNRWLGNFRR